MFAESTNFGSHSDRLDGEPFCKISSCDLVKLLSTLDSFFSISFSSNDRRFWCCDGWLTGKSWPEFDPAVGLFWACKPLAPLFLPLFLRELPMNEKVVFFNLARTPGIENFRHPITIDLYNTGSRIKIKIWTHRRHLQCVRVSFYSRGNWSVPRMLYQFICQHEPIHLIKYLKILWFPK